MNRLRQILLNIRNQLGGMNPTQKLLIGSLMVIALMTLFLVSQYAARPAMVDLMQNDPNLALVETLNGQGVDAKVIDGRLMVPPAQRHSAVAQLSEAGQMPGDTTLLFHNLMDAQDWKASRQQNRQQYMLALQNELARVITKIPGITKASVFIDAPEPGGLGRASRKATASVTVFSSGGSSLPQPTIDAIARLVSGPVSGLDPKAVQVIEGSTGRPRTVTSDDEIAATSYGDLAQKFERRSAAKIHELLAHIPGVVVTVTAHVDATRVSTSRQTHMNEQDGTVKVLQSSRDAENTATESTAAAEPGVRSNAQADLNRGGPASGTNSEEIDGEKEFAVAIGAETTQTIDPRGMATYMSASVTIPQSYIEGLIVHARARAEAGDGDGEDTQKNNPPTEAQITERFDAVKPDLEKLILPHLTATGRDGSLVPGAISIAMAPIAAALGPAGSPGPGGVLSAFNASGGGVGGSVGGGFLGALGDGLLETILVATLAGVALVMMFMMIRRAGKHIELPTPEEFVGIPPRIDAPEDMVGEAEESELPLEAIEIDEASVVRQKMLEQVGELVKGEPTMASRLVGQWIGSEN